MNISLCILDRDSYFTKAFMGTVALDHAGFAVRARSACGPDCLKDVDACIDFGQDEAEEREHCEKAFQPLCGKYAGVEAILREARAFVSGRGSGVDASVRGRVDAGARVGVDPLTRVGVDAGARGSVGAGARASVGAFGACQDCGMDAPPFRSGALVCVYACAGGLGASTAAIGTGRELARYRGERVLYLSLEDAEDPGLFPAGVRAQRAEELLFRYLRFLRTGGARGTCAELFRAAPGSDEYGLLRLAPDDGLGSLAGLLPEELYDFLSRFADALKLTRIVLDFGTRLYFLKEFAALLESGDALFVEATASDDECSRKRKAIFGADDQAVAVAFPYCEEDVRRLDRYVDIGLANAFGLAVKELCDKITGDVI